MFLDPQEAALIIVNISPRQYARWPAWCPGPGGWCLHPSGPRPDTAQHFQSKVKFNETAAAEPEQTADWNVDPVAGPSPQHHTTSYLLISATRGVKTDDLLLFMIIYFVSQYFCAVPHTFMHGSNLSLDCEKSKFVCNPRLEMSICNSCMYQIRTMMTKNMLCTLLRFQHLHRLRVRISRGKSMTFNVLF